MRFALLLFVAAACLPVSRAQALKLEALRPVMSCGSLTDVDIAKEVGAKTHIDFARPERQSGLPDICLVRGTIDPAVEFEIRLPKNGWTQRFVQTGCGGLCGRIDIHLDNAGSCQPAKSGEFVLASTDMGHEGGMDGAWGRDDHQARVDFAYRGVHVTALASKALIRKYYGRPARFSYFVGCSDGGREALIEAQRFPRDFDGITSGAPAMNFTTQNTFYHAWNALKNQRSDGTPILTSDMLTLLHAAVLEQCDAIDGLKDGLISDPLQCHPNLSTVTCQPDQPKQPCLTAEQAETALQLYKGAHDSSGRGLVISGPLPGSEINWEGVFVPPSGKTQTMSAVISEGTISNLASDPNPPTGFTLKDFAFDGATFEAVTRLHGLYDATNTDLRAFRQAGGRLILWHGMADPHISPLNTVAYYQAVMKRYGSDVTGRFLRLYLFPGGAHCSGGEGPFEVDLMSAIMAWVETRRAPEALLASRATTPVAMPNDPVPTSSQARAAAADAPETKQADLPPRRDWTRPIFPYPQVARYIGSGDIDDAANYRAATGEAWVLDNSWYGARFFRQ